MHSYSALFPLLAISLLNGAPVHSNSPHSPYTQLKTLTEEVSLLKKDLKRMKSNEDVSETLLTENKQLTSRINQLESENKKLQDQLKNLDEAYKKQTEDLSTLSQDFQSFRLKAQENNNNTIKNRELVSVKRDISQIRESLNSTQRRLADDGARNSQNLQNQLQKVKSEILEFCQETNQKLQDFSEQMKTNFTSAAYNGCKKHTISSGESLASIARLYGTTPDQILSANHLQDTSGLHVGDAILVPQEVF